MMDNPPSLHPVIQSYLTQFLKETELYSLPPDRQFEAFAMNCVVANQYPEQFDVEELLTGEEDESIDGIATLIGDGLVLTVGDAMEVFEHAKAAANLEVFYLFVQAKRSPHFDMGDILKFTTGVTSLFGIAPKIKDDRLQEFLEIHQEVVRNLSRVAGGRPTCELHYLAPGEWKDEPARKNKIDASVSGLEKTGLFKNVTFIPIDREGLIRLWMATRAPVQAAFSVRGMIPIPGIAGVAEAYLALAPASEFVDKVLTDDNNRIRVSVFEQNVRAFLGDSNPVNEHIRAAVRNTVLHDRFATLNNGLTIVAPDVRVQSDRVSVVNYQIVNGCQTSHVLFRNRDTLSNKILIPVKLIESDDPEFIAQVVEATNSQTNVAQTQFYSLRPFLVKLQAFFDAHVPEGDSDMRLYFERRSRQYAGENVGRPRIFDIQRLARAFAAMFLDLPHLAARYPTQIFKEKKDVLFQSDHREIAYYTAALALYRFELAFGNNYVQANMRRLKWHALMVLRHQVAGKSRPPLSSNKIEGYCQKIINVLKSGGKSSIPPLKEALDAIASVGVPPTRDRLKGQKYTQDLLGVVGTEQA